MERTNQSFQWVEVADRWRKELGYNNRFFAQNFLGRDETEWNHAKAKRRYPSSSFVVSAHKRAAELGGPWHRWLEDAWKSDQVVRRLKVVA